jgi:hypothetical protein
MKKILAVLVLAGSTMFAGPRFSVGIGLGVPVAPAPVYAAPPVVGVAPGPGYAWTPGYFYFSGGRRLWHAGYWGPRHGFRR